MVIGASWEQVPLLRKARDVGCDVFATNGVANPSGFELANASEIVDPRDLTQILEVAKANSVWGVTADQCDYSNYAANFVRQMLSLPSADLAGAQLTTNKHWMRVRCHQNHVVQPRFQACRTLADVQAAVDLIDYPIIVKPVDNRGSFGVRRVDDPADVDTVLLGAVHPAAGQLQLRMVQDARDGRLADSPRGPLDDAKLGRTTHVVTSELHAFTRPRPDWHSMTR